MKILDKGTSDYTTVYVKKEGHYVIQDNEDDTTLVEIKFQEGPINEAGINGIYPEDLINICIDRLELFQKGDYSCRENALVITKLEEAIHWLRHRTDKRAKRGIVGTREL